jgi:hypothetical protein
MPTNGEKQPRWLMICKCGARVKASGRRGRDHPLYGRSEADLQHLSTKWTRDGNPAPLRHDCRTIEVRSNGVTVVSRDCDRRSLLRWNSILRSKALE